jgi:hypothetical protein
MPEARRFGPDEVVVHRLGRADRRHAGAALDVDLVAGDQVVVLGQHRLEAIEERRDLLDVVGRQIPATPPMRI